jgi:hypothetical protein
MRVLTHSLFHLQCALRLRAGGAKREFQEWEIEQRLYASQDSTRLKTSSNAKQHGSMGETNQAADELSAVPAEYLPASHWTHDPSLVAAAAVE